MTDTTEFTYTDHDRRRARLADRCLDRLCTHMDEAASLAGRLARLYVDGAIDRDTHDAKLLDLAIDWAALTLRSARFSSHLDYYGGCPQ